MFSKPYVMTLVKRIGDNVKIFRKSNSLKMKHIAQALDMDLQQYRKLEAGEHQNISLLQIFQLVELGMSVHEIFNGINHGEVQNNEKYIGGNK